MPSFSRPACPAVRPSSSGVERAGRALLVADRKRLKKTTAIGLDKTSFVKLSEHDHADYGTTIADVAHDQIIDILPSQPHPNRRGGLDRQQR